MAIDMNTITDAQLIAEFKEEVKCWTCDKNPATHSTFRDALGENELTCDKCHREEYPEEEEESDEEETPYCYADGKHSAPIPCGCPQPCCVPEEEEVCPSCNKIINADENPCGPGCPLYDEGLEDEEEV